MSTSAPFIHLMQTPYGHYFFDVNTHNIYKTEEHVYAFEYLLDREDDLIDQKSFDSTRKSDAFAVVPVRELT